MANDSLRNALHIFGVILSLVINSKQYILSTWKNDFDETPFVDLICRGDCTENIGRVHVMFKKKDLVNQAIEAMLWELKSKQKIGIKSDYWILTTSNDYIQRTYW